MVKPASLTVLWRADVSREWTRELDTPLARVFFSRIGIIEGKHIRKQLTALCNRATQLTKTKNAQPECHSRKDEDGAESAQVVVLPRPAARLHPLRERLIYRRLPPYNETPVPACANATGQEGALAIGLENAAWFRQKPGAGRRDFSLQFTQGQETRYDLQLKKRNSFLRVTLTERKGGEQKDILDLGRIPENYFGEDSWASVRMSEKDVRLAFRKNAWEGMETRVWGQEVSRGQITGLVSCAFISITVISTEAWTGTAPPDDDTTPADEGAGGRSDDPVLLAAAEDAAFGERQNKRLRARLAKQGSGSRSRLATSPSAGLGVQTSEVEFFQVRNPSLMVAAGTLPSSHTRFAGGHHHAVRSMSQPAPTEVGQRKPPSLDFPAPPASPPPGYTADDSEAEDYVNAETLMIEDSGRRGQARDAEPFPRSVDSLLRELQFE
ncbi:hypothetical protein C7M84_016004 [Penaeus vannamei]|uniref:Uncharacterized protein n=1 Tax=Penaeus vannamei TaxID=6689 RepID=A0A423SP65_PENVA|nr:hypothetical protein C7M84_016004 [Penaeus vannamei]